MKEKEIENKRKVIITSSITIAVLTLIIGISYAFWQSTKIQEDTNVVASGCFGVNLEGNNPINLANSYPIRSEEGMKTTPYTFTITNTCSGSANYIVNLESLSNTTFQNSSIRVALDDSNKLYSEYRESSKYYSDSIEARTLISGTLENNESVTHNLRMWIDENAPATEQNKIFASKIVVTSGIDGEGIEPTIENLEATSTTDSINIIYQANGDITLATCKWGTTEGTYDNEVADATAINCNITGLNENTTYYYQICIETGKGSKCVDGEISTLKKLAENIAEVKVGDYIRMTPTSTSYTISKDLTGYTSEQIINPSELNLWRVIKKNDNGTIDVVSEYVTSEKIYFKGTNGYKNLVGGLNTIATQYANNKYVQSTRHMGYSNQTETCTEYSASSCYTDIGYEKDVNLIKESTDTLIGKNRNGEVLDYWLASRSVATGEDGFYYSGRFINSIGELRSVYLLYAFDSGSISNRDWGLAIRPILTLKSNIGITTGDGKSSDTAYAFE